MQENNKNILARVKEIAEENGLSMGELLTQVHNEDLRCRDLECRTIAEKNQELVGKFFVREIRYRNGKYPDMKQFLQVLSCRSSNEHRVECLVFDEHPTYCFEEQQHWAAKPGDHFFGRFSFASFRVEDIPVDGFSEMREIKKTEFAAAARQYTEEMLSSIWVS